MRSLLNVMVIAASLLGQLGISGYVSPVVLEVSLATKNTRELQRDHVKSFAVTWVLRIVAALISTHCFFDTLTYFCIVGKRSMRLLTFLQKLVTFHCFQSPGLVRFKSLGQVIPWVAILRPFTGLDPLCEIPVNFFEGIAIFHRFPFLHLHDHDSHPLIAVRVSMISNMLIRLLLTAISRRQESASLLRPLNEDSVVSVAKLAATQRLH